MGKIHRNIYEEHLDHLKTYVQKPYKYLMIDYTNLMRNLFEYNQNFQHPRMRIQLDIEADWDKRNTVVPEKVTIK